ncbi:hypothetical protein PSAC2689_10590 [Paraburkholderia sacchari]
MSVKVPPSSRSLDALRWLRALRPPVPFLSWRQRLGWRKKAQTPQILTMAYLDAAIRLAKPTVTGQVRACHRAPGGLNHETYVCISISPSERSV